MAGCDVVAKYNSADVHIAPAEKAGQVTVFPDCIVREVLVSDENRATGVRYLHRVHQQEGEVRGRAVVVACACVQSIALLLMSTSSRYPTGLANSSGQLGRHFIPHFTGGNRVRARGSAGQGRRPTTRASWITPTCRRSCTTQKRDYARSFGAQLNYQNRRLAGWAKTVGGFGRAYKAVGEGRLSRPSCSSRRTARCCRTRSRTSISIANGPTSYGLPLARRHVRWGKNEEALFNDMVRLEPGDRREGRGGSADRPGRPGDQSRDRRLPDGPRPAHARSSTPTAGRTTCRTSTSWTPACSRRRRRRTRRTPSWPWRRVPPTTLPTGCEGVTCDDDDDMP